MGSGYLSKHPNVVRLIVNRLGRDPCVRVKESLGRWAVNSGRSKVGASNALTVLCQGGVVLSTLFSGLRGAEIENA